MTANLAAFANISLVSWSLLSTFIMVAVVEGSVNFKWISCEVVNGLMASTDVPVLLLGCARQG